LYKLNPPAAAGIVTTLTPVTVLVAIQTEFARLAARAAHVVHVLVNHGNVAVKLVMRLPAVAAVTVERQIHFLVSLK
jgi:hypothetical protein